MTGTAVYAWVDGRALPWLQSGLAHTFLATWKDGKVITVLAERSAPTTEILLKGLIAAGYILVLPAIHPPTRAKLLARVRRRAA